MHTWNNLMSSSRCKITQPFEISFLEDDRARRWEDSFQNHFYIVVSNLIVFTSLKAVLELGFVVPYYVMQSTGAEKVCLSDPWFILANQLYLRTYYRFVELSFFSITLVPKVLLICEKLFHLVWPSCFQRLTVAFVFPTYDNIMNFSRLDTSQRNTSISSSTYLCLLITVIPPIHSKAC